MGIRDSAKWELLVRRGRFDVVANTFQSIGDLIITGGGRPQVDLNREGAREGAISLIGKVQKSSLSYAAKSGLQSRLNAFIFILQNPDTYTDDYIKTMAKGLVADILIEIERASGEAKDLKEAVLSFAETHTDIRPQATGPNAEISSHPGGIKASKE